MKKRIHQARRSLVARTVLAGAAVLGLSFVLLVLTPISVSTPVHPDQAAILFGGVVAMIAVQLVLVRRALAPLRRLADEMQQVDPIEPTRLLMETPDQGPEIAAFVKAFNDGRAACRRAASQRPGRAPGPGARAAADRAGAS
jgi:two-component system, NarL family, sensor histidine kinase UhpB